MKFDEAQAVYQKAVDYGRSTGAVINDNLLTQVGSELGAEARYAHIKGRRNKKRQHKGHVHGR